MSQAIFPNLPTVAVIGAGASGLMVADYLSSLSSDIRIEIYDRLPSAGRKILWAGKTGLNVSHSEPMKDFVGRYDSDWLAPYLYQFDNAWLVRWLDTLGVQTYVGSSGRIFPVEMKASKFVRAWLRRLTDRQVTFFYGHHCQKIDKNTLYFTHQPKNGDVCEYHKTFDAIVLCCGGGSYPKLGTDGSWQAWFDDAERTPLYASNVGVLKSWSDYMTPYFGQPLKRVALCDANAKSFGDIIITHYGLESGLIYKHNRAMREALNNKSPVIYLDLLPDKSIDDIQKYFSKNKKQSLNNHLRKMGLSDTKIALLREYTQKTDWSDFYKMANFIKKLPIMFEGFRPMSEAISTGGGVKQSALTDDLQLKSNPHVFCCGEMLDFDAPTGGYLLTACFATGQVAGRGVARFLGM
ncbi:MAG: TIGR03862 family flavoprotein [Moraxella sp.]|uniref:TIGR03862 family flavoprotein n=1 Tax=Moraxella sp. TaxID=479 RepID=UPI0026DD546E|nr:TIGR03862 family flavoprotein [Moraxella sp.]MDO4449909.1 TIGR03862 family flavoprotein [Moraxella sp.]